MIQELAARVEQLEKEVEEGLENLALGTEF